MNVDPAPWMVPLDTAILSLFDTHRLRFSAKVASANIDYERHYCSRRFRALKHAGLLFKDENGLYAITPYGDDYLTGTIPLDAIAEGPPTTYHGQQQHHAQDTVTADDVPLKDRVNFATITIDDYTWGYRGTGPRQLALALAGDIADGDTAMTHANTIMTDIVADLDPEWQRTRDELEEFLNTLT